MTATVTKPRPLTTGRALWNSIPNPVRRLIRARVPLDCADAGGAESLMVAVGGGVPLRWLQVEADAAGMLCCRLWEVRQRVKEVAKEITTADGVTLLLQRWALAFGLSA